MEIFTFGLFSGLSLIFLFWIILLFSVNILGTDDTNNKFYSFFPVFRGSCLFILAVWMVGLNVHIWNKYYVNYKLIFGFMNHFS